MMLYCGHLAGVEFELATLVVISTDCIGSCKANYKNNDYWINSTLQRNWKRRVAQDEEKQNKNKTQYLLDTIIRKQTQIP